MELAIDTSSHMIGIALSHKGEVVALQSWLTTQNHTVELLPNLVRLLGQLRAELNSLEAIFIAKGPGSFNGLRVGMSTAKGLAFALSIPLVGIGTLEAQAYPFAFTGLPIRPVQRAGCNELATAVYQQKDSKWQCLEAENITTIGMLCRRSKRKTVFCGEIPADVKIQIQQRLDRRAIIVPSNSQLCASSLAALGWLRLSEGTQDDPVALQPLYLRPPHITKRKERMPPLSPRIKHQG